MSRIGLHKPEESVYIGLQQIAVVGGVQRNRLSFDGVVARVVGDIIGEINAVMGVVGGRARPITQVGDFVHIEPHARELDLRVQVLEHVIPVFGRIGMKVVHEQHFASPHLPNLISALRVLDEHISLLPLLIRVSLPKSDAGLHDWNVVIFVSNFGHTIQGEPLFVDGEGFKLSHVVDVRPDCV